jgi:toxin ParE1/3/4
MGAFLGQPARATNPQTIDDMNVAWSREAIDDLARLRSYISENDPSAAQRVALYILHQVEVVLPDNPEFGRTGRVVGTRELVVPKTPFIVPYRMSEQSLEILRIYHVAQRWPEVF